MSNRKQIGTISFHTDDDTGMYEVGEMDGGWNSSELETYIKRYGADKILVHLSYMASTVIDVNRKINSDKYQSQQATSS